DTASGNRTARPDRRFRDDDPRGTWRARARQDRDEHRFRRVVAGLYRGWIARDPLGDCRRTDPPQWDRCAKDAMAASYRFGRGIADGGIYRAEHRFRPRQPSDTRRAEW